MVTRWLNDDSIEYIIASTYASAKGRLFEIYFGWRQTKEGKARFVFSRKDWERIDEMIEYSKRFLKTY